MATKAAVVTGVVKATATQYTDFTVADFGTVDAAIIVMSGATSAANPAAHSRVSIGFWDGTNVASIATYSANNSADTLAGRQASTSNFIERLSVSAGPTYSSAVEATVAATTNGIRVTTNTGPGTADYYASVILFGGTTNQAVGAVNLGTGTSAINVTDPGFRADLVFALSICAGAATATSNQIASFGAAQIAANDTVAQGAISIASRSAVADSQTCSMIRDDAVAMQNYDDTLTWKASVGAHASGFTITPSANAGSDLVYYLALELADPEDAYVAIKDVATGSGGAAYTGAGFTPQALILGQTFCTAVNTNTEFGVFAIGAGGPATTEQCIGACDEDAEATTDAESYTNTSNILHVKDDNGADEAVAALDSLDSDGWTLAYSDYAASARKMLAVAIGNSAGGATTQTITPTGIGITVDIGSSSITAGSATITTSGVGINVVSGSPTVSSSGDITTTGINVIVGIGSPTISAAGGIVTTGHSVQIDVGTVSLSAGAVTISPTGVSVVIGTGSPSVDIAQNITTSGHSVTIGIGTASVTAGAVTINTEQHSVNIDIGSPILSGPQYVEPTGVNIVVGVGTPTITGEGWSTISKVSSIWTDVTPSSSVWTEVS